MEIFISLHAKRFFDLYFGDDSEFLVTKFFAQRGDLDVSSTNWVTPTGDEAKYDNQKVISTKKMKMRVQIKGNPFVKEAPTTKTLKILENSEDKIVIRNLNRTTDVPYCDSFGVEEEYLITSLPGTKCCVFRVTFCLRWYKWTMMKAIITSNTEAETPKAYNALK